ncbi:MAG: flp pilus-assembly TadE/G-like family protein [Aquiluna sp.]|nr:flp pilus-assembly TadE/G-like family protein [Aquiluna sp.]
MRNPVSTDAASNQEHTLHASSWKVDRGSAAAMSLIFVGAITFLLLAVTIATDLAHAKVRSQLVADAASLTAADTIRGLVSGIPCENADLIAVSNGAFTKKCRIVGTDASVTLTKQSGFVNFTADSVAGSPT